MNKETDIDSHKAQKNILRTTGIIGGSQFILIIIGIIRTKIVAILLGAVGVGYIGLYQSVVDIVKSFTGLGLTFSAVRNISEAKNNKDIDALPKVVHIVRRWVLFTGILGTITLFFLSDYFSIYTFGNYKHSVEIKVLSIVLLLGALSGGQLSVLQGYRKIGIMAKANLLGAIIGLFISLPLYFFYGLNGIVPTLVLSAFVSFVSSWFFFRKLNIVKISLNHKEIVNGGGAMVKLGVFTVITSLAGTGSMYLVRVFITNESNIIEVGLFQAAWTISSLYLSMILNSMITDYFPSLSSVNSDNKKVNKLVNHQSEIALLIACPIIVGMLFFMPLVIRIMYSSEFTKVIPMLQWMIFGDFFKIIAWPIGVILLAKAKGNYLIYTEISWNLMFLLLIYFGWDIYGLEIVGISFFIGYFVYLWLVFIAVQPLCDFRWNMTVLKLLLFYAPIVVFSFLSARFLNGFYLYVVGVFSLMITVLFSINRLDKIINIKEKIFKFKK